MANGNDSPPRPTVELWKIFVGQIPWVLTILALGAAWAARMDARLTVLERSVNRIEVRQQAAADEQLRDLTEEVKRFRRSSAK